jgi:hypothetical protein
MPQTVKTTTLAGVKYEMTLLGGETAMLAASLVTAPALRALDEFLAKVDLQNKPLDELSLKDLASIPGIAAKLFEGVGFEGVRTLTKLFAAQTTAHLPSPAKGDLNLYATPLASVIDTHFVGKWPTHLAWLGWGVHANGFFDLSPLASLFGKTTEEAKELLKSRLASTGTSGA